jgi:hypothetical protein
MGEVAAEAAPYEVAGASAQQRAVVRPYAPSWLDLLFDWLARLPGPTWLVYLVLVIPSTLLSTSALWLSGLIPVGTLDQTQAFWGVMTVAILGATHHLRNVAGSAFDAFRPALGAGVTDAETERYELTVMPARSVLAVTVFSLAITPLYYVSDPEGAQVVGLTGIGFVPRIVSEGLTSVVVLAILLQATRQIRRVTHLHEVARNVDPFRPMPLYAFSRLTAQTAIVLILFNAVGLAANTTAVGGEAFVTLYLPWLVACFGGAILIFAIPLRGMHRRLEEIRDGFQAAAGGRLSALLAELNEAIDARDAERVKALDGSISALRHERELLAKLPAWPWSTSTIRGFGSALFLPILLFLIQRVLGQLLG